MNLAGFLLCFIFLVVGYVMYPTVLPSLLKSNIVKESSLRAEEVDRGAENTEDSEIVPLSAELVTPIVLEEVVPEVVEVIPEVVTPNPVIAEVVEEKMSELEAVPAAPVDPSPVEPAPVVADLTDAQVVSILRNSVKAGEVGEFNFDQVVTWRKAGKEDLGGVSYVVGMVNYNATTLFGDEQLSAKALIKDGVVYKWLWPATNTEMR